MTSGSDFATAAGSTTVFYTPDVVNGATADRADIGGSASSGPGMLAVEAWLQEQRVQSQVRKQEERPRRRKGLRRRGGKTATPCTSMRAPPFQRLISPRRRFQQRAMPRIQPT